MAIPIVISLLFLGTQSGPTASDWLGLWRPPLETAQQARNLSVMQIAEARSVQLTGVVTHAVLPGGGFYLQDSSAGILVNSSLHSTDLQRGDRIALNGVVVKGEFSPCIVPRTIRRLGVGPLPEPYPFNLTIEDSRWLDGQWVQIWAVVQNARSEAGRTFLDVYSTHGRAVLVLSGEHWTERARRMRNEAVIVRGVCAAVVRDSRISDPPSILIAELPTPLVDANEPHRGLDAPRRLIDTLLQFTPHPHPGTRRVKISGTVTALPLPHLALIQDPTGGAAVWSDSPLQAALGSEVEAYGLLRLDGRRITLTHTSVVLRGKGALPQPIDVTLADLASGARDAVLVRMAGSVETVREVDGWTMLGLSEQGSRFNAYVPGTPEQSGLSRLERGTKVSVAGVASEVTPDGKPPVVPGLFCAAAEAVTVVERPARQQSPDGRPAATWWTGTRAGYLLGGIVLLCLLGCGWLVAMRVQVRRASGEVKRHSDDKARLEKQLRQASKLEAVGRLAGGIAHDFNNILTIINGCTELLEEETLREGGRVSPYTHDIRNAGERAASLTGQLLTFSRRRDILIAPINLNDAVEDNVRLIERVIGEQIRIEKTLGDDLPAVRGDPVLILQVMMNLALNAKDAMPNGGTLSFRTQLIAEPTASKDGWSSVAKQFVRLTVADTGSGMTEEVKARLFEPFFTTKEVGCGTGLGLATVHGIVQTMRGRVQVHSVLGQGSTFQIDLRIHGEPISDAEMAVPSGDTPIPLSRAVTVPKLLGKTVMIVEDNDMVRNTLVAGLRVDGASVLSAGRPDQAIQLLNQHSGRVDVLVTDVVMPGMSGPVLAERLRASHPSIHIVYMSGYTADEVLRQGVLEEQVEFMQKPFTPDQLVRRLQRVLGREDLVADRPMGVG